MDLTKRKQQAANMYLNLAVMQLKAARNMTGLDENTIMTAAFLGLMKEGKDLDLVQDSQKVLENIRHKDNSIQRFNKIYRHMEQFLKDTDATCPEALKAYYDGEYDHELHQKYMSLRGRQLLTDREKTAYMLAQYEYYQEDR